MKEYFTRFVNDKKIRFSYLTRLGLYNKMSDEKYLKKKFFLELGYKLNLEHPETFNEKIQWLKLHDRKKEYINMVDKYEAKKFVSDRIGSEYIIETIGIWNTFDEIDFEKLPDQFVLKSTHDSGGVVICNDKSKFDINHAKTVINKSLKRNYYYLGREWPYKDVPPRIIAEKYMGGNINDYKLMCFNGHVKCTFVCSDRKSDNGLHITIYDSDWNVMPFKRKYPRAENGIDKPYLYDQMVEIAEKLSANIPFIRVDFYEIDGKLYFGELTFYPGSGFESFDPVEWDRKMGELINLDKI